MGFTPPVVEPLEPVWLERLQAALANKTKPVGSLGRLEDLAAQLGAVQRTLTPSVRPLAAVFAADHGVAAEGVSAYPQEVTRQMVLNFLQGGAAINVIAACNQIELRVIDCGVIGDFPPEAYQAGLVGAKVAHGTANFARGPAMSERECREAWDVGAEFIAARVDEGYNVFCFGEMGIGNTSAASALMAAFCGLPAADCVGRGAGLDEAGVARKAEVVAAALRLHALTLDSTPLAVLAAVGGLEIAAMAGGMLQAAARRALVVVDGFISSAAALTAARIRPAVLEYCVFSHCSGEAGHRLLLRRLRTEPLLDLGLRLGEGSGAALVTPLLYSAARLLCDMATFDSARVSREQ